MSAAASPPFFHAHATHPDARLALALVAAQIEAQREAARAAASLAAVELPAPNLGWVYFTDHLADQAEDLLVELRLRWPGVSWVGTVGVAIAASGVEYLDEPALVLMLGHVDAASFTLYSGEHGLNHGDLAGGAHVAQVHADGHLPDLGELIHELSARTHTGYLFGGLAASRGRSLQICAPWVDVPSTLPASGGEAVPAAAPVAGADASAPWSGGVYEGGVSGVAFGPAVDLISRVTQGCQPVGPVREVTGAEQNLVLSLDGEPALPMLLHDIGIDLEEPRKALPRLRATLVGLSDAGDDHLARGGQFGADTRVRHLIGLDPARSGVAVGDRVEPGMRLAFCQRDVEAARRDLVRICAEIREELSPPEDDDGRPTGAARRILGAVYVSCNGRGGAHFGGASAEMQIVRHALGDVPLVGFFAGGEIARHHLYGYTGVLTVFVAPQR
ncbi:MAG: FIST C-terminal domain-containing protein [Leptothrix sp. (in: b-proteobacteria)]